MKFSSGEWNTIFPTLQERRWPPRKNFRFIWQSTDFSENAQEIFVSFVPVSKVAEFLVEWRAPEVTNYNNELFFTVLVTWSSCWFALEGVRGDSRVQRPLRHPEWRKQVAVPQFLRAASLGPAGRERRTWSGKKGRNWHFKEHRKSQNVNLYRILLESTVPVNRN